MHGYFPSISVDASVEIIGSNPICSTKKEHMYSVIPIKHDKYGDVIEVAQSEDGNHINPFLAIEAAKKEKRLFLETGLKKIKFLVDGKIMTISQAESWANEEYKTLPKCETCAHILTGDVYTHQFCGVSLFCSQDCADKNLLQKTEIDNEESEFELF